jgi:transposase InsO family protein
MTDHQQAVHLRKLAIKLFENTGNVTQVCKRLGRSRTWFYKWVARYRRSGELGLLNQQRMVCPANRTPLDIEGQILAAADDNPSYGPQRIAQELNRCGIPVGKTAVHGVLKRHGLNKRRDRLEWVRKAHGEIVTRSELESARDQAKSRHIQAEEPGELVGIDTFYVGCLKGVGRIYQLTACDNASSFAWAKLYTHKTAQSAVDFLYHIIGNDQGVTINNVLTDNGLEFTTHWESGNHRFENALKEQGVKHRYTRVKHPWTNGFVERLNRTILEEFYQVALRKKRYLMLHELQQDLSSFIQHYNFNRPHQGYRLNGSAPADLFCSRKHAA